MLTKNEFLEKLEKARASQLVIENCLDEIFEGYNLVEVPFKAVNTNNLEEAIQCYIHYGELPLSGNIEDFWKSYKKYLQEEGEDE